MAASSIQSAGRIAGVGLQLLGLGFASRSLGQDLAPYVLALGLAQLMIAVSDLGVAQTWIAHPGRWSYRTLSGVVGVLTVLALVVALVGTGVLLSDRSLVVLAMYAPAVLASRWFAVRAAAGQAAQRHRRLALGEVAGRATGAAGCALSLFTPMPIAVVCVSAAAGFICAAVVVGTPVQPAVAVQGPAKSLVMLSLPLGAITCAGLVHTRIDQVLLAALGKESLLPSYAISYRAVEGLVAVLAVAAPVVLVRMARESSPLRRAGEARAAAAVLAPTSAFVAIVLCIAANAVVVVLGEGDGSILRLLAPTLVFSTLTIIPAAVVTTAGVARKLVLPALVTIGLNVGLVIVLLPTWGIAGVAVATLVSEAVGIGFVMTLAARVLPGSQAPLTVYGAAAAATTCSVAFALGVTTFAGLASASASAVLVCALAARAWRSEG